MSLNDTWSRYFTCIRVIQQRFSFCFLTPWPIGSAFTARSHHVVRPLSRAFSSPLVSLNAAGTATEGATGPVPLTLASAGWNPSPGGAKQGSTSTALAYDVVMLRHQVSRLAAINRLARRKSTAIAFFRIQLFSLLVLLEPFLALLNGNSCWFVFFLDSTDTVQSLHSDCLDTRCLNCSFFRSLSACNGAFNWTDSFARFSSVYCNKSWLPLLLYKRSNHGFTYCALCEFQLFCIVTFARKSEPK